MTLSKVKHCNEFKPINQLIHSNNGVGICYSTDENLYHNLLVFALELQVMPRLNDVLLV